MPEVPGVRVTETVGDYTCTVCGAFVPHELVKGVLEPVQHDAPCGRPCAGGGVDRRAYLLGAVHRENCVCQEEDE